MTATPHTYFTITCDAPSCGATYASEHDRPCGSVRRDLAERGWTTRAGANPSPSARLDYCSDHKPPAVAP